MMSTTRSAPTLEWVVATASAVLGVACAATGLIYGAVGRVGIGPGTFPLIAGVCIGTAGILWLVRLVGAPRPDHQASVVGDGSIGVPEDLVAENADIEYAADDTGDGALPDRAGWARIGAVIGSMLTAALLLDVVGYTIAVTVMIAGVLVFVSRRRWWVALPVAAAAALVSRLVFETWLGISLPTSAIDLLSQLGV